MAAITPTPRYNHGPLRQVAGEGGQPGEYVMPEKAGGLVKRGFSYTVQVWECPECSYVELHDGDKQGGER